MVSWSTGRRTVTPSWSAWSCSSRSMAEAPPSTRRSRTGRPAACVHGLDHVAGLERHGLHDGAGQVGARRAAGDAGERAAGVRIPPGAAEAGEGGHEHTPRRCRARTPPAGRPRRRGAMSPSPSRSHWTAAPVTKMAPSRAYAVVPSASVQATVVSRPSVGGGHRSADVHEHEAAGAVGVLRGARLEAGLPEQRGLLVAGDAGDRDAGGQAAAIGGDAEAAARRADLGQGGHRHAEQVAQLGAPGQLA